MRRFKDWADRYAALVEAARSRAFVWGEFDCALWAADGVLAQTGHDFAAPFRGRYRTAIGAAGALKRYGAGTLEATVESFLGGGCPVSRAGRGDVVMVDVPETGLAVGLVALSGVAVHVVGPAAAGLRDLPIRFAARAWRIDDAPENLQDRRARVA